MTELRSDRSIFLSLSFQFSSHSASHNPFFVSSILMTILKREQRMTSIFYPFQSGINKVVVVNLVNSFSASKHKIFRLSIILECRGIANDRVDRKMKWRIGAIVNILAIFSSIRRMNWIIRHSLTRNEEESVNQTRLTLRGPIILKERTLTRTLTRTLFTMTGPKIRGRIHYNARSNNIHFRLYL